MNVTFLGTFGYLLTLFLRPDTSTIRERNMYHRRKAVRNTINVSQDPPDRTRYVKHLLGADPVSVLV